MSEVRTHVLNSAALLVAVGVCVTIALTAEGAPRAAAGTAASVHEVRDADGTAVPVRVYRRIASLSPIADAILLETVAAERLVGVSGSMRDGIGPHRFDSLRAIDGASVEEVLALDPDLVIVSGFAAAGQVAQLRATGVTVFVMGEMRGVANFRQDAQRIGQLVGAGPAGDALGQRLAQRMRMVAADVPLAARPRGLYLGVIGNGLYGGANRTSYHDVLEAAGLRDAAAHLDSWPELTPEQVLAIDPDVVIVHENSARLFCQRDGLRTLRACRREGGARVVELPSGLLNDPGLGMLPCAERLRALVHAAPSALPVGEPGIE